jgi:hypothetical protein
MFHLAGGVLLEATTFLQHVLPITPTWLHLNVPADWSTMETKTAAQLIQ